MNAVERSLPFSVTNARVLAIAVPMTLSNATTPLLGVVATAAIGRLGQAHVLGAVAIASIVFDCLFWLFGFLRMGTVALTAQALGAGDRAEERATLVRALLLAGLIGLALIALQVPLAAVTFALMVRARRSRRRRKSISRFASGRHRSHWRITRCLDGSSGLPVPTRRWRSRSSSM